ncbi:hypothetical protein [Methylophaga sp. OBS4]|uniref:hypothetical protein n=1 Tax=Methylophaga sp. OBS4 TaxID=2991935 RepID=UPI00224F473A|nr:hypothetical protein [Methylophaga sp. OBS4]MCX4186286.1 hypothetical protein [Methylophaga sp. OBS4]
MSRHLAKYTDTLAKCMINYQFVEESLKFCLYRCQAIIKFRLWDILPYEVQLKSIDDAALGRLIDQYKAFTKNEPLIKQLRIIKNHRDFCAHQGFLLTGDEQKDDQYLAEKKQELEVFLSESQKCMDMLKEEMDLVGSLVEQVYARLCAEQAAPVDADIVPPLS